MTALVVWIVAGLVINQLGGHGSLAFGIALIAASIAVAIAKRRQKPSDPPPDSNSDQFIP